MDKTQKFLYSEDDLGNKFIIHTRDPLCIYSAEKNTNNFTLFNPSPLFKEDPKMEGLLKRANDWYIFTILNKKK